MGNCFGKSSSNANFQGEGRTIGGGAAAGGGASPAQAPRPAAAPSPKVTGPGRTLGDNTAPSPSSDAQTPASAAARAAEVCLHSVYFSLFLTHIYIHIHIYPHRNECSRSVLISWVLLTNTPSSQPPFQERLKAAQGKGKLGKQLDAQKSQTQKDTLASTARENVAAREADAAAQARAYN